MNKFRVKKIRNAGQTTKLFGAKAGKAMVAFIFGALFVINISGAGAQTSNPPAGDVDAMFDSLTVNGTITASGIEGPDGVSSTLFVESASEFAAELTGKGISPVFVDDNLDVSGAISNTSGDLTIADNLDVSGDVDVTGDLDVSGLIRKSGSGGLNVNDRLDLSGNLYFEDNTIVSGIMTEDPDFPLVIYPEVNFIKDIKLASGSTFGTYYTNYKYDNDGETSVSCNSGTQLVSCTGYVTQRSTSNVLNIHRGARGRVDQNTCYSYADSFQLGVSGSDVQKIGLLIGNDVHRVYAGCFDPTGQETGTNRL